MYFLALATDYDGTLANHGVVSPGTIAALKRLKSSGRRLILVTGREVRALREAMDDLTIFDIIVAENGALLYDPLTNAEKLLSPTPPMDFVARLESLNVAPLSVGRCVIATWHPHEATVLSTIQEFGLDLQISFNKGAVMILPQGVSKVSGLAAALSELKISNRNTVGIGDAENDHSFLETCGLSATVSNALPSVKKSADIRVKGDHGAGVSELIDLILDQDEMLAPVKKHGILYGTNSDGQGAFLMPRSGHTLVVGPSGSGKSTLATTLTEHMVELGLNFCVMDPEGDYYELQNAVCVGSAAAPPNIHDALRLHQDAGVNIVVNSQALRLGARQILFRKLLSGASLLRENTGKPHWLVIDEAHEVVPANSKDGASTLPLTAPNIVFVTMYPETLNATILKAVSTVIAFGETPATFLATFADIVGLALPESLPSPRRGEAFYWCPKEGAVFGVVRPIPPKQVHHRHIGKYATGDVGAWHSFFFRGASGECELAAHNLYDFIEISDTVSDAIWDYHLRAGHFSTWFRDIIRDDGLACDARVVEKNLALKARESRRIIRKAIWRRYAAPCERVGNSLVQRPGVLSDRMLHTE